MGYTEHFGLRLPPFNTAPDPRFAYQSIEHELAMLRIQDGIEQRVGLCLLVGEIGAGKSTVAHLLLTAWVNDPRYKVAYIPDPSPRTNAQFRRLLNASFGLPVSRYQEKNQDAFDNFLMDTYAEGKIAVALIDESQTIHADNMEIIQHLTNKQLPDAKLLQIALFAQPNFYRRLDSFKALESRIARRGNLDALLFDDAINMLRHRVSVAGGDFDALFDKDTHRPLYNATQGNPRRLCILCDNALVNAAFRSGRSVSIKDVEEAIKTNTDGESK